MRGRRYIKSLEAKLSLIGGHVATVVDGEPVLIDTVLPASFGRIGSIEVIGDDYDLLGAGGADTIESVVEGLRKAHGASPAYETEAALGSDVLWDHVLELDFQKRTLKLSGPGFPIRSVPERVGERLPAATLFLDGPLPADNSQREFPAALHTGSKHSFLAPGIISERPVISHGVDFLCGIGRIETALRRAQVKLLGKAFDALLGDAPPAVVDLMDGLGVKAILGTDVLSQLGTVSLEFRDRDDAVLDARPERATPRVVSTPYPHVVIRFIPAVYQVRKVRFVSSPERKTTGEKFVVQCAEPVGPDGFTLAARQALVKRVLAESHATGHQMCCVFGEADTVYCRPDGKSTVSRNRPSGGLLFQPGSGLLPRRG